MPHTARPKWTACTVLQVEVCCPILLRLISKSVPLNVSTHHVMHSLVMFGQISPNIAKQDQRNRWVHSIQLSLLKEHRPGCRLMPIVAGCNGIMIDDKPECMIIGLPVAHCCANRWFICPYLRLWGVCVSCSDRYCGRKMHRCVLYEFAAQLSA